MHSKRGPSKGPERGGPSFSCAFLFSNITTTGASRRRTALQPLEGRRCKASRRQGSQRPFVASSVSEPEQLHPKVLKSMSAPGRLWAVESLATSQPKVCQSLRAVVLRLQIISLLSSWPQYCYHLSSLFFGSTSLISDQGNPNSAQHQHQPARQGAPIVGPQAGLKNKWAKFLASEEIAT